MGEVKLYGTIRVRLKRVSNRDDTHISQDNTAHSKFMDIAKTTGVFSWKYYGEEAGGRGGGGGEEGRRSQEECDSPPTDELGSGKSAPPHSSAVTSGAPQ